MEHHGKKLKAISLAKGFNIKQLSEKLNVTRVAVERNFKAANISRKVLLKYSYMLDFNVDEFYESIHTQSIVDEPTKIEKLQQEIIYWQRKYIDLQERFFPNAAQLA
ncbi:hypothetical protein G8759_29565 [Spirosoma aureum]|uniref:Helix-turn-helix transcriptional regulator n=1 Tax=Spirosoma aureum TaxID=2692134 RepID=A0A6G9AVZ2_9BACT|nr:hypothetical protein [Spirosoma aureum]QIP16499.1 hypothetical protein G8759_29565 [Spirosoma aureum]